MRASSRLVKPLGSLSGHRTVTNVDSGVGGLDARCAVIGTDPTGLGLQVLVCDWSGAGAPSVEAMRRAHRNRLGKKIFPLVVATVDRSDQVWLMGPAIDAAPAGPIPASRADRLLQAALNESTGLQARKRVAQLVQSVRSTDIAGMTNAGLFATHYLAEGIRDDADWPPAAKAATPWLKLRGEPLIAAMGYTITATTANAHVLTTIGHQQPRAVAVLLDDSESFDADSPRFAVSPVRFGLNVAQREGAPWLIVLRASQLRLYAASPGVGVGARGQAETFFELDLALLDEPDAAYLAYSFSADALREGGLVQRLIDGSQQYATGLGERLRQRVYDHVVPTLAVAVANQLDGLGHGDDLALAYRITLRILFRLLFQAYAEDRGLLPYGRNDRYTRNSLNRWARDMVEQPDMVFDPDSHAIWGDLKQVWGVVDTGDVAWDVPAYDGGLFGSDPDLHPAGALVKRIEVDNSVIGDALRHLLVDDTEDGGLGPVDFRSLSVREFGTIYEGLLESSLSRADQDLTLDKNSTYVPASSDDEIVVKAGEIYFHNASGERKATGSYFTPHFAVEHLLERALGPALDHHLQRIADLLNDGDQAEATEQFFDFRVADLAMGSGHFLVSGIDHIEAGMAAFLVDHDLPGVTDELRRLEDTAHANLGDAADDHEIEPSALLRRQIARRCIYGIDINDVAVELARVAVWIHTFVPGLPMSSLDHNLVHADSLTGIGTIDEAIEVLDPSYKSGQMSLYSGPIVDALEDARTLLVAAANASEATKAEVRHSWEIYRNAQRAAEPTRLLFDAAVATRTGLAPSLVGLDVLEIRKVATQPEIAANVAELRPAHMPYLFPEVFLRENPGFDVLIGNPPWEKIKVEEHSWWGLRFPGLHRGMAKSKAQTLLAEIKTNRPDLMREYESDVARAERVRQIVLSGPYPGIGQGDVDLYQAFAWRNWLLLREGGVAGTVLPRGALIGSGTRRWRQDVLGKGGFLDVCFLTNRGEWVFEGVHGSYSVALTTYARTHGTGVAFAGPFFSYDEYVEGRADGTVATASDMTVWSESLAFPYVPDAKAGEIFKSLGRIPKLKEGVHAVFRPLRELDASNDDDYFDTDGQKGAGSIPVLAGSSINMWNPDAGPPYAYADREVLLPYLLRKAKAGVSRRRSAFYGMAVENYADLPLHKPRIAYKDVTSPTNSRSAIACLLPPDTTTVHSAPVLVRVSGTEHDEAYLLGVMCSIPFDWYVRRWVELHLTFEILNRMPVPQPESGSALRVRVVELAGRLAASDDRYQEWANAVGVPVGALQSGSHRFQSIAELDALVAHLYGLTESQLRHIFETFQRGWDHTKRWGAVQKHYQAWKATA